MRRFSKGVPKLPGEMRRGLMRRLRNGRDIDPLAIVRIDEILRAQQVSHWMNGRHERSHSGSGDGAGDLREKPQAFVIVKVVVLEHHPLDARGAPGAQLLGDFLRRPNQP